MPENNNVVTAELIQGFINNQKNLADNLNAMGVQASASERFDGLIPKVLRIPTRVGIVTDSWMSVNNTTHYTIENINFIPAKIAMSCDDVLNNGSDMVVQDANLVAMLNVDFPMDSTQLIELDQHGRVRVELYNSNVIVYITQQIDGKYSIEISLDELNEVVDRPYYFKGGYEHTWVVTDEGWFSK